MIRQCVAVVCAMLLAASAWAFEPFVISDIRVEGLQRISVGTVFNYLPLKVGERLDDRHSAKAIRSLFKSGFFDDVRLERDGDVLVVFVRERPAIASIEISGNDAIDTEELMAGMKQAGLATGRSFDPSLLEKVEIELRSQYHSFGKYGMKLESTVTPLEGNRVAIDIKVREGLTARIKQINIIGNKAYSDDELLGKFELSTPTLFSFYTKKDQYSKPQLAADLETLRSFYQNRGYINFNIDSTQVAISPDKKDIYLTINITEGDVFTVKGIKLAGDLVVDEAELKKLIVSQPGAVYSRKDAIASQKKLEERLGEAGYAFANINVIPDIDKDDKTVGLTFFVDPGKRVYVRRINFSGNVKTIDEVLRREMRQMEGGWISTSQVSRSRTRLSRLGFFEAVNVETPRVPGREDQVDVNFSVAERPSGNLMAAIGYSQTQGLILNASISQNNFMGTGKRVALNVNNSDISTVYSLSYTNPYYTLDGISRGFDVYYKSTDAAAANISSYTTDAKGGAVNFGVPVNEFDRVNLGLRLENTSVQRGSSVSQEVDDWLTQNGEAFNILTLSASWAHDTRNAIIFPTRGGLQRLTLESTVPGLDLEYYRVSYDQSYYLPLHKWFTLGMRGSIGYGDNYGDTTEYPFFKNYYAGGVRSVRGYRGNTLGPVDSSGYPLGGNMKLIGGMELFFPPPFQPDSQSIRLSAFVDVGNVYGYKETFDVSALRGSVGIGVTWLSPLGALAFSLAQPFNNQSGDDIEAFQFTLGSAY